MEPKTSTDNQDTLAQCQAILIRFCQAQADAYITASSEYLFQQAGQAQDNEAQRRYFEARDAIQDQHDKLPEQLKKTVSTLFDALVTADNRESAPAVDKNTTATDDELAIIDNDEMELKVAISSMSHRAEADFAEALFALTQRTALLNNGVKPDAENSPYAPQAFCNTLLTVLETLSIDQATRLILLKLFDRHFVKSLASVYHEINEYLISANILPNLKYRQDGNRPIAPRRRKTDNAAAMSHSEDRQVELFNTIQSILESNPFPVNSQLPVVPVERLIAELGALQGQQLMRFSDDAITAAPKPDLPNTNTQSHQQAIECVGVLFEYILNDNTLPDSVKSLISHLHTPLLKLALLDKTFLSDPKHQARQLINTMIGAGERWVAPDSSVQNDVYPRMRELIKRVITEFSHDNDNDAEIFTKELDIFSDYLKKLEHKADITEQRSVQAAKGKEMLNEGRAKVDTLVREKLANELLPKPIVKLISDPWAAFLAYTLLRHGEDSTAWQDATNIIDNILWYIEPKLSEGETELVESLRPELLSALEHGLSSVGLSPSEIHQHVNALEMCKKLATENALDPAPASALHAGAEALNQQQSDTPDKAPFERKENDDTRNAPKARQAQAIPNPDKPGSATIESAPVAEPAPKKQPPNTRRPPNVTDDHFPEKQAQLLENSSQHTDIAEAGELVKLSDVIETQATDDAQRASDDAIKQVLSLEFGTWLDWQKANEPARRLKLTWYNQTTQNCMLSNQMGQQVAVVSANDIALGMSEGWISISNKSNSKPFFERMLETVADRLRVKTKSA